MIKILTNKQIKELYKCTIKNDSISSMDLIDKTSKYFVEKFINYVPDKNISISIYSGTGNNGANGLSICRFLFEKNYLNINIKIAHFSERYSLNFTKNLKLLSKLPINIINLYVTEKAFPQEKSNILIDSLLGSGLNRLLSGIYSLLVNYLNSLNKFVFSVDIPTGFFSEGIISSKDIVLKSNKVISFQRIPINFLLPESSKHIYKWKNIFVELSSSCIKSLKTPYYFIEKKDISKLLKKRKEFQNKWNFGHALIVAGNSHTMGAALLCSDACLHTGTGLTSACIPIKGLTALNIFSPEVIFLPRPRKNKIININWKKFTAIAIGPGLGCNSMSFNLFKLVLKNYKKSVVIDADALNILAKNNKLWNIIPENSLITPHIKEFDRLFGKHFSWWERLETIKFISKQKKVIIILKNRYSIIGTPNGKIFFNPTGNSAMSIGGMGDVLTGIIVSLIAQGYSPDIASLIGVYIHGKSGDDLVTKNNFKTITPRKIIAQIANTWASIS